MSTNMGGCPPDISAPAGSAMSTEPRKPGHARLMRADYLVALSGGLIGERDVLAASLSPEGMPLRKITLRNLVGSRPGFGPARTRTFLSEVAARLEVHEFIGGKTVSWLLDPRARGVRLLAWVDPEHHKDLPWPGFPCAPRPQAHAATCPVPYVSSEWAR